MAQLGKTLTNKGDEAVFDGLRLLTQNGSLTITPELPGNINAISYPNEGHKVQRSAPRPVTKSKHVEQPKIVFGPTPSKIAKTVNECVSMASEPSVQQNQVITKNESDRSQWPPSQGAAMVALTRQLEKALSETRFQTLPKVVQFLPDPNSLQFISLIGLEVVTDSMINTRKPKSAPAPLPPVCAECATDFTPSWTTVIQNNGNSKVFCEECASTLVKKMNQAEHTDRFKKLFINALQSPEKPKPEDIFGIQQQPKGYMMQPTSVDNKDNPSNVLVNLPATMSVIPPPSYNSATTQSTPTAAGSSVLRSMLCNSSNVDPRSQLSLTGSNYNLNNSASSSHPGPMGISASVAPAAVGSSVTANPAALGRSKHINNLASFQVFQQTLFDALGQSFKTDPNCMNPSKYLMHSYHDLMDQANEVVVLENNIDTGSKLPSENM